MQCLLGPLVSFRPRLMFPPSVSQASSRLFSGLTTGTTPFFQLQLFALHLVQHKKLGSRKLGARGARLVESLSARTRGLAAVPVFGWRLHCHS
jgi:hypothetical protein